MNKTGFVIFVVEGLDGYEIDASLEVLRLFKDECVEFIQNIRMAEKSIKKLFFVAFREFIELNEFVLVEVFGMQILRF